MLSVYLIIVLIFFIILLYNFFYKSNQNKNDLKQFPGPKPNFLFGNTLDFLFIGTDKFIPQLNKYIEEFGPIISVKSGPLHHLLVVSDPDLMEFIITSNKFNDKARDYIYFHNWLGTGLLTSTGKKWKKRRKIITPSFHFSILEHYIGIFESVSEVLIRKLRTLNGEQSIDIYPLITLYTLDVICEAAMGKSVNAQMNENCEYVKMVKVMCKVAILRATSPFHDYLYVFRPLYYKERKALKILHAYTNNIIKNRMENRKIKMKVENGGSKRKLAFLDLLLESTIDGKPLSVEDLREEVDTFVFEGHDTTASAISFALYSIANHPDVQDKILEEQISIFGDYKNVRPPTYQDLNEMKYLELVIKESLRLYPSVPIYGRNTLEDFEYNGYLVKKDVTILLFPFGIHRNPKYYSEPEKFIPERFLDSTGTNPFTYLPFSAGTRNCVGQKFAMLEMKSAISKIIRNFKLGPAKPQHTLQLAYETILISKNGIKICIENRK